MVVRNDVLATISVISALLIPEITDVLDGRLHTNPPELGVLAMWLQGLAFNAIWYSLVVSLGAAYYAEAEKVYADLTFPIWGLAVAVTLYFMTLFISGFVNDFGFVNKTVQPDTFTDSGMQWAVFTSWFVPNVCLFVAVGLTLSAQNHGARSRTRQRYQTGLGAVDDERRLATDPLGPTHARKVWGRQ